MLRLLVFLPVSRDHICDLIRLVFRVDLKPMFNIFLAIFAWDRPRVKTYIEQSTILAVGLKSSRHVTLS